MKQLHNWLAERFDSYEVDGLPKRGAYGIVFLMKTPDDSVAPRQFAIKTVSPDALTRHAEARIREEFQHELRLWLRIPSHLNVLPALGLDFAPAPDELKALWPVLPLVRMPYCDTSLRTWTENAEGVAIQDRLLAISQACNGLSWLYENGIQGHADLKPDNLLLINLLRSMQLRESSFFPSRSNHWQVRVADLGWANAWLRANQKPNRGWRPYAAPERLDDAFVPEKSDVFSMGVIASELLANSHPTGLPVEAVAKWSDKKWGKWIHSGQRAIDRITAPSLKDVIFRCLDPDPSKRPTVRELRQIVDATLRQDFEVSAEVLDVWTEHARQLPGNRPATQAAWQAQQTASISQEELSTEIVTLQERLAAVDPEGSPAQAYDWLEVSKVLMRLYLLRRQSPDVAAGAALSEGVLRFVLRHFNDLDIRALRGWTPRRGPHDLRGFDAWEAIYGYADYAAFCLREFGQSALADELGQVLRSAGNSADGPTVPWLTRITGDLDDEDEPSDEDGA